MDLARDEARRLAQRELADPAYRAAEPSLVQRAIEWIVEQVTTLVQRAGEAAPGGWLGILGLVLLIVVAVLVVRWRVGPVARTSRLELAVDPTTSAAQYRAHADELAAAGQWEAAIAERMRGLVRGCQERGLIDAQPGRTADEVARDAGAAVPGASAALAEAARTFDDVRYGGRPGTARAYRRVAEADDRVQAARHLAGSR